MPTYEFECNKCGYKFEVFTSISKKDKTRCPKCGSPDISQLLGSFYMKGGLSSNCGTCKATTCGSCTIGRRQDG